MGLGLRKENRIANWRLTICISYLLADNLWIKAEYTKSMGVSSHVEGSNWPTAWRTAIALPNRRKVESADKTDLSAVAQN